MPTTKRKERKRGKQKGCLRDATPVATAEKEATTPRAARDAANSSWYNLLGEGPESTGSDPYGNGEMYPASLWGFNKKEAINTINAGLMKPTKGKSRPDLLSPSLLLSAGSVMLYGAERYGDRNYLNGTSEVYRAALLRHVLTYLRDPTTLDESGESHLAHILANCSILWELDKKDAK